MKERPLSAHPAPFVFSGLKLETASLVVILSLLAQVALMIAFKDARALLVILASLAGAAACEVCFASPALSLKGKSLKFADGSAAIHGLVAGFLLPSAINPFLAAIASFFGLFVARNFFNGRANSWINSSVLSVVFAFISAPLSFEGAVALPADASLADVASFDYKVSGALNSTVFKLFGVALPEGYVQLFFNPQAAVPAFKFGIVTILFSIILIALDVIDWIAPAVFVAVYAAGVFFFSPFLPQAFPYPLYATGGGGNILFALFSSGVFFAAVYLLSDFPSLPRTRTGRLALGVIAGCAALFACGRGGASPIGAVFAVFAANLASLAIEYVEDRVLRRIALRMSDLNE